MIIRIALFLFAFMASPVRADMIGYSGVVDLSAEAGTLRAEHHHDWRRASQKARESMFSWRVPFSTENDYSYLRLRDSVTGVELFRRPVPALTYIWISPDLKYVVGLSYVMISNPYQLVVFSRSGDRLLERDMIGVNWPGVMQSVTNWIRWYKEPVPKIAIVEKGTTATLSVEDPLGVLRQFPFPAAR
ncbi:hypothetical protein [Bradyrhizobium stylosanthis]|uniref:Uncharacterized protein n=1 Tax=Bradyrhizobium stylosanthis TaxID=1803665 RepID=A0A560EAL5_9BRAD|nr:hypothetical protein [Bradyrhizobium stylosanthis]TWB06406.1 hypothetical protein FBZ96_101218 [Bradyrhizobium stylosanthis]